MKDMFDVGYIKRHPEAATDVMAYVIERRRKHLLATMVKKPKPPVPRDVALLKIKRRMNHVV